MSTRKTEAKAPFACNMSAIPAAERELHFSRAKEIFASVRELVELTNGYSFRLSDNKGLLMEVAAFVDRERLCCPFFDFRIDMEAGGELWLSLTGREGIKPFIRAELGSVLGDFPWPLEGLQ